MTLEFVTIYGQKIMTDMMQAVDMFESWKVVGKVRTIVITHEDESLPPERIEFIIRSLKSALEQTGHIVSLIYYPNVTPYINERVKVVSDGNKWGVLHNLLTKIGVPHTTDDNLFCYPKALEA